MFDLTISIPTYNRSGYLKILLKSIKKSYKKFHNPNFNFQVLILDNSQNDESKQIAEEFIKDGVPIKYYKNNENIGSDMNILNAYTMPESKYVHVIGDDDFITEDYFIKVAGELKNNNPDILFINSYSYDEHHAELSPISLFCKNKKYDKLRFLNQLNLKITFISAMILKRSNYTKLELEKALSSQLIQVDAFFLSLKKGQIFKYMGDFLVGCKRNNSGGYDPVKIFVENFFHVHERFYFLHMDVKTIKNYKDKCLLEFYSHHFKKIFDIGLSEYQLSEMDKHYEKSFMYNFFIRPHILKNNFFNNLKLNFIILLGRLSRGDLTKGLNMIMRKII